MAVTPPTLMPVPLVSADAGRRAMWGSTIALKLIAAATGVVLFLFVIGHMLGNLQVFLGADVFNAYGEKLREFPLLLFLARAAIAIAAVIHVVATIRLALLSKSARPVAYAEKHSVRASLSSRTMVLSGLMVLAFVVYHLAHFTWRVTNPAYQTLKDAAGRPDIYSMVIHAFESPVIAVSYVVAMILLGFHLSHGLASIFQTMGLTTTRTLPTYDRAAFLITALIVLGYVSIPLSIMLGIIS